MKTVNLDKLCDVIGGGTPSKGNAAFYEGDIPWATIRDMRQDIITHTEHNITKDAVQKSSTNIIPKGNVIIATRVGLGKVCTLNQDTAINQDIRGIIPRDNKKLDKRFLFWWMKSVSHLVVQAGTGATVQGVKLPFVKSLQIPLVSINEQKRIVSILDEVFSGIDKAIANAEQNLANARELFESYLNNIFTQKGKGWIETTLNEVCIVERGSSPRPIKAYLTTESSGVNWVKIGDTKGVTKYVTSTKQKITPEGALRSRVVNSGDFILTNSMSYGRPYIMATTGYIHDGWFVLRLNDEIDTDFFYHLLTSRVVQEQFKSLAAGSVVKNISGDLVKQTVLPIPPLERQIEIVETIERLSKKTQYLETIYQQKLDNLAELKQSILQKAFAGELTQSIAEVIPITSRLTSNNITSPSFAANVIAYAYYRHAEKNRDKTFGRVKEQKTLHLIESIGSIDLGRNPVKDAAGPNDFNHMLKAEKWARKEQFFEFIQRPDRGYDFKKLVNYDKIIAKTLVEIKPYKKALDKIIDLICPMDSEATEVFATVHAAWNNLVLNDAKISDEAIIYEARENWHPDKLKISKSQFHKAIKIIRDKGLIPDGTAKRVVGQESLL